MALTTTTTYTDLPQSVKSYYEAEATARTGQLGRAADVYEATKDYTPYEGPRIAGLNANQLGAYDRASTFGSAGAADRATARGIAADTIAGGLSGVQGYRELSDAARSKYDAATGMSPYAPGAAARGLSTAAASKGFDAADRLDFDPSQINQWLNPYLSQVVDATSADLEHAQARDRMALTKRMGATGALRGSDFAVQSALLAGEHQRAMASALGGLRAQGFNDAAGMGLDAFRANADKDVQAADLAQMLATQQQTNEQGVYQQNMDNLSALAAQGQEMAGARSNDALGFTTAIGAMGDLGSQDVEAERLGILAMMDTGNVTQANEQASYDTAYADFIRQQEAPRRSLDWWMQTNPGETYSGSGTYEGQSRTETETPKPSTTSQLIGLATAAAGLF